MIVDDKLINKLAKLSSLELDENKKESIKEQLAKTIDFVENLNSVDLGDIDENYNQEDGASPLREDIPSQDRSIAKSVLEHAPKSENGYFIVPKIIE